MRQRRQSRDSEVTTSVERESQAIKYGKIKSSKKSNTRLEDRLKGTEGENNVHLDYYVVVFII